MTWLETLFGPAGAYAAQVLEIIGIDIVLAGDNAVVIALACRTLPPQQRTLGIVAGAATAVALRIVFTLIMQHLLDIPLLKLAGGLLLTWIAVKLVTAEEANEQTVASGTSLLDAVRIIAIADMVMSLDNVLAIAAASQGDAFLVILGLLVSIPLVVGGATLVTRAFERFPALIWAGAGLLGWVAGELIASEPVLRAAIVSLGDTAGLAHTGVAHAFGVFGVLAVIAIATAIRRVSAPDERG